jgi:hypothetical protein
MNGLYGFVFVTRRDVVLKLTEVHAGGQEELIPEHRLCKSKAQKVGGVGG